MHLISTISKKWICSKFPWLQYLKINIITQKTAYKYISKKKFTNFDLKPDGPVGQEYLKLRESQIHEEKKLFRSPCLI